MSRSFAPTALMLGNFVTGVAVMAPAAMLNELSAALEVSVRDAALLITFGAVVLCIGSPLTAWLTSRIERRTLLVTTLAVLALTNLASAFAPSFAVLLAIRLAMLAVGALYTPQSAGAASLIVAPEHRGSTMSFVFLGWSLAIALGLPLITFIASRYGWRAGYGFVGVVGCVSCLLLAWRLPRGLVGSPVDLKTWAGVGRNRLIMTLLLVTTLLTSGQFIVITFLGPLLTKLAGAGPDLIGLVFAIYGVSGFFGNIIASRIVDGWGANRTMVLATVLVLTGLAGWALGAGSFAAMAAGVAIWGLGFAASNSMQQVRLVGADPPLSGASVSLNTSMLYVGQAIGSGVGGVLFANGHYIAMGYAAVAFVVLGLVMVLVSTRIATPP